ncbi:MAG: TPM domain-containing protein [Alsobacter sp.]
MLNEEEHRRIGQAIREAETQTRADIVCVVARQSSSYSAVPVLWAALVALLLPWPVALLSAWSPLRLLTLQVAAFILVATVLSWGRLRFVLVPRAIKRIRAERAAFEHYYAHGLTRTPERLGLLIFVSFAERYIRVVADDGLCEWIPDAAWRPAIDALADAIRRGELADGLVTAIAACREPLALHFPARGGAHALPDKVYVV